VTLTYISVGDSEKLSKFLDLNPSVPRDRSFVDDSRTFDAYVAVGFGKIGDGGVPANVDLKPPGFSPSQWFAYLTNVAGLSPIRKDEPLRGVPEGVLRLGGTFVLDRRDVLYAHSEELPGMSPPLPTVLAAAGL